MPGGSISIVSGVNQQDISTNSGQSTGCTEACRTPSDDDDIVISLNCGLEDMVSVSSLTKATKSRQKGEDAEDSHLQVKFQASSTMRVSKWPWMGFMAATPASYSCIKLCPPPNQPQTSSGRWVVICQTSPKCTCARAVNYDPEK